MSAICYMLSNTEIRRFQAANAAADLLADGTLFNYLVRRSLESAESDTSVAAVRQQLSLHLEAVCGVGARSILEIGSRSCRWGGLIQQSYERSCSTENRLNRTIRIKEIEFLTDCTQRAVTRQFNGGLEIVTGLSELVAVLEK